jgi:Protein of unknown function (DUF1344)
MRGDFVVMKKFIGTALALALLALPGLAYAIQRAGVIKNIDASTASFMLDDGSEFLTSSAVSLSELQPGAKVIVVYEEQDGKMIATKVTPAG